MEGLLNLTQDKEPAMTDKAISPLRRRMIEDMTIRTLGPETQAETQAGYIRGVKNFAAFLGHSADRASGEDIRTRGYRR